MRAPVHLPADMHVGEVCPSFLSSKTNLTDPRERGNLSQGGQLGARDAQLGELLAVHGHDALHFMGISIGIEPAS